MFEDPTILDELDHLYKTLDLGKKLLFYFQPEDLTYDGQERQSVAQGAQGGEEAGQRTLVLYKDKLRKSRLKKNFIFSDIVSKCLSGSK